MIRKKLATGLCLVAFVQVVFGCLSVGEKRPGKNDPKGEVYTSALAELVSTEMDTEVGKLISKYLSYGCYCGQGGLGKPRDDLDRCCQHHDKCYDNVSTGLDVYFVSYKYEFDYDKHKAHCDEKLNEKKEQIKCMCDRALGLCLRTYDHNYNMKYHNFQKIEKYCE